VIRVFDLDGVEKTVTYPDGTDYLVSTDPKSDFRAVTVADYTFFVNRSIVAEALPALSPGNDYASILFIKEVAYDRTYTIKVAGVVEATYTTMRSDDPTPAVSVKEVVDELHSQLVASLFVDFEIQKAGSIIWIQRRDFTDFAVTIDDDDGNNSTDLIRDKVQRFTDLPALGRRDHMVTVTGDDSSAFDEYYLKFTPDDAARTFDDGVWEETVAPGIEYQFDPSTMPHVLVRMPDGSFELREELWGDRIAGDEDSAPWPSFVGSTINDVYFDRRRLCFLSGDSVSMSKRGDFFNFMPESVLQVLDDGRIDVATSGSSVANLQYAVPFNQKILLFSAQTQYEIADEYLLASKPPGVKVISNYQTAGLAGPVAAGRTLFLGVDREDWSGVLEYYVLNDTNTTDAADITEHVPEYIPSTITCLTSSPTADIVVALTSQTPRSLWVYKHHWQGNNKLQSSWSEWRMPEGATVRNADFIKDVLVLVVDYADGVYIETIDVSESKRDAGEAMVYRLDRRVTEAELTVNAYDVYTDTTTFVLPYQPGVAEITVVTRNASGTSNRPAGQSVNVIAGANFGAGYEFTVMGDYTATKLYVGILYSHEYEFTQAVLKTASGTGGVATSLAGRLQIKRWLVHVENTGYFRAEVLPVGRTSPFVRHFTGTSLGGPSAVLGSIALRSSRVAFRVNSKSDNVRIKLVNDSFLPSAFTAAEWEAMYTRNTSKA